MRSEKGSVDQLIRGHPGGLTEVLRSLACIGVMRRRGFRPVFVMAACALAIRDSVIPPTINLENPGEECDLDYTPNVARERKVRIALNNSFGFGGHNATLVAAAFEG